MTDPIAPWPGELVDCDSNWVPVRSGAGASRRGFPGHRVSVPGHGRSVFVRTAPAEPGAEPVLLVHGLGGSSLNWTDLMDLLRLPAGPGVPGPDLACEAIDLPGFGYSPAPADGDYSVNAHAAAVIALISQRGRWPVHLVGNSLGGAVCTRVAARRPDLVRTLTLVSPALPDLRPRLLPLRLGLACTPGIGVWVMNRFRRLPAEARTMMTLRDCYWDPGVMDPKRRDAEVMELQRRDALPYASQALISSARGLIAEYARQGPGSLWHDAARVTAPTLVIHGSHDKLVNPASSSRAARIFGNARVVLLPRTGHVAMMERPDRVAIQMRDLIAASSPAALPR
jgi:pimeloyl-ACP methyl ester carboxylesterase